MISNTTGVKRKSRFGDSEQDKKRLSIDVDAAAARAAEISKELTSKVLL